MSYNIKFIAVFYFFVTTKAKIVKDEYERVEVQLYYESLCPACIQFDTQQFSPVVEKMSQYLDIHIYPYGNAYTFERNGEITFRCQHGPAECYGNKLHACAIEELQDITQVVVFNACMMRNYPGSNDIAADECSSSMSLDPEPIKECAKGPRGTELLQYYGEESKAARFRYVPYILINGKESNGTDFMRDVCNEFNKMPKPCVD